MEIQGGARVVHKDCVKCGQDSLVRRGEAEMCGECWGDFTCPDCGKREPALTPIWVRTLWHSPGTARSRRGKRVLVCVGCAARRQREDWGGSFEFTGYVPAERVVAS